MSALQTQPEPSGQEIVEGIRVKVEPAPVMKRLMAAFLDMSIITTIIYLLAIPSLFIFGASVFVDNALQSALKKDGSTPWIMLAVIALLLLFFMAVFHLYYIYFEYKKGATPGKKLFGLKVVSVDGKKLTRGQVIYRDLVRWYLDSLLFIPAAISMMVTERRQRVGDVLAGTMVVYSKSQEESREFLYVSREDYRLLHSHLNPTPVPQPTCEAYLRFANAAFLMSEENQLVGEKDHWLRIAREHLIRTQELGLNDLTVLRFFAELCYQQTRTA